MTRPKKHRHCRQYAGDLVFKPRSIPMSLLETIPLEQKLDLQVCLQSLLLL